MSGTDNKELYEFLSRRVREMQSVKDYKKGDAVQGKVIRFDPGFWVIRVDDATDAIMPISERDDSQKNIKVGDVIDAFVLIPEDDDGVMVVSQRRTTTSKRWELLERAYGTDTSVVVTVVEANSGGVIVEIDGVVGFIPTSLLDPNRVYKIDTASLNKDDAQRELTRVLSELVGSKIRVKVVDIDREKSKVIFSERLVLDDQSSSVRKEMLSNMKVGDVFEATVTAVTNYGVFVNANGVDGLVHVSEISWDKVENPADYVTVGSKVKVMLIDVTEDGRRVAYSMKQLTEDPWQQLASSIKVGSRVKGCVSSVEDYGLILKITQGVTGLVHKSEIDGDVSDLASRFSVGDEIEAVVVTISPSDRKMGLSIKRLNDQFSEGGAKSTKGKARRSSTAGLDVVGALAKAENSGK